MVRALDWLRARDRGLAALRRAGRTALVMPAMFALGDKVIGNPIVATFAAFGSFSMLLLVDFGGPRRDRLRALAALAVVDGALVSLATIVSNTTWLAVVAMVAVAFVVLFAGVLSSVLASATTSLLLAFILPVSLAGPASSIPDRLAGWGLASAAALAAIALLWPAPARDPLREAASAACRAFAERLHLGVAFTLGGAGAPSASERDAAVMRAEESALALRRIFFATPYRPTGLSTATRMVVRMVDELNWLSAILVLTSSREGATPPTREVCAVKSAAADLLEQAAVLLSEPRRDPEPLRRALTGLQQAVETLELGDSVKLPVVEGGTSAQAPVRARATQFITALDPSFRAQELAFVASQIASNVDLAAAAERRSWLARLLGRPAAERSGAALSTAQDRAGSHAERHSVWLHNSLRGAAGLGLAVLVAQLTGVQHGFWVVFGTLSVLRSNALSTGQNVLRGLVGTAIGFVVGAALVALIGTDTTVLWVLLPFAVLVAGVAPAAISFAAGQAAFTLTLLILFNLLEPAGWQIGLVRIEDVALGGAVSLVVGLLFWPRGAAAALGHALGEAYTEGVRYLSAAVAYGMARCSAGVATLAPPSGDAARAAAAARRLDDTFRGYLAERGAKPVPLAEVTGLVTGVAGLRLAADAVLDLWQRDVNADGDRAAAQDELLGEAGLLTDWYTRFAASLSGVGPVPDPLLHDEMADGRLLDAISHDLLRADGEASATAARMIWTGDHLDAARRLQLLLVEPARAIGDQLAPAPLRPPLPWRPASAAASAE